MPRKARSSFETATARLKLPLKQNKKPYWERLGPGLSLGYRRNDHAGSWSIRAADGAGGEWLRRIGTADDYEHANSKDVLSYEQAVAEARRLYRGKDDAQHDPSKPVTLDEALTRYESDLIARSARPYNARIARYHLTPSLLSAARPDHRRRVEGVAQPPHCEGARAIERQPRSQRPPRLFGIVRAGPVACLEDWP